MPVISTKDTVALADKKMTPPPPVYMGSQKWVPQLLDNTKLDYNHPKNPMFFGGSGDLHQINAAP